MKEQIKNIFKCVLFLLILLCSLTAINKVLVPKYILKNSTWPTTSSYRQFYKMEPNSIDVLFLGSSVCVNAFIPQEIYNDYGIRSYNLGSEQQSIFLSYYWLKEALRSQKPQVVVLDTKFMWDLHPENPINTTEGLTRKCLDPMHYSDVKKEAVHNLCELDKTQSELSYYLTNIRFHSRWSELAEYDIDSEMVDTSELKGFAPITDNGPEAYTTYEQNDAEITMEFPELMQEYLDKTVDLCKENGITLILVSLPGNEMNDAANNTYTAYAHEKGIDYYNLCSTSYYNQIGAVLPEESVIGHENIWGAIKTSKFIGGLLSEKYAVNSATDDQYEQTKSFYEEVITSSNLVRITSPVDYLEAINNPNYMVFMAGHGDFNLSDAIKSKMHERGIATDSYEKISFYVALTDGGVIENSSPDEVINYTGSFRDKRSIFTLTSGCQNVVATSVINIEGIDYSKHMTGLNIAVYDMNMKYVIDQVCINGEELTR